MKKKQEQFQMEKKIRDEHHQVQIKEVELKLKESSKEIQELITQCDKANLEISEKTQIVEKLRAQLVENEKNQQKSQSQLEQNMQQKIKELDVQNEQYLHEISSLKSDTNSLVQAKDQLTKEKANWQEKESQARLKTKESEERCIGLENQIENI